MHDMQYSNAKCFLSTKLSHSMNYGYSALLPLQKYDFPQKMLLCLKKSLGIHGFSKGDFIARFKLIIISFSYDTRPLTFFKLIYFAYLYM